MSREVARYHASHCGLCALVLREGIELCEQAHACLAVCRQRVALRGCDV